MAFQKGKEKTGGRIKGQPNKLTEQMRSVKQTVLEAFHKLQEDPNVKLEVWGKKNPKEFYTIASKLIPTEIQANILKVGKDLEDELFTD